MRRGLQFICILIILLMAVSVLPASAQLYQSFYDYNPPSWYELVCKADLVPGENNSGTTTRYVKANDDGTLTFFVENQGCATSTPCWTIIYQYLRNARDVPYTYAFYIPALAPGQKAELWPIFRPPGWLGNFRIIVDYLDTVDESNELNNEVIGTLVL